jgi:hypothetical protein
VAEEARRRKPFGSLEYWLFMGYLDGAEQANFDDFPGLCVEL